jgi:hypothetical protein
MQDIIIYLFLGALIFYQLRSSKTQTLLAIICISIFVAIVFYKVSRDTKQSVSKSSEAENVLYDAVATRKELSSPNFDVSTVSKTSRLKYLMTNKQLVAIAEDLRFTTVFDKGRFGDLLVHLNQLQKVYMYLLARRYQCKTHVHTFIDLRDSVLEVLYSFIFVVPATMKHAYGIEPHEVIRQNIVKFTSLSRVMLKVLENYCKDHNEYFPSIVPKPYEPSRMNRLP